MTSGHGPTRRRSIAYQVNKIAATNATTQARNQPGHQGSIMFA
jgi:hypothetical protein